MQRGDERWTAPQKCPGALWHIVMVHGAMLWWCHGAWCNICMVQLYHGAKLWWCHGAIVQNATERDHWKEAMQWHIKQCHIKAISLQCNVSQTKCSLEPVQNKAAQSLILDWKGKKGWIESWMSEKNERNVCQTQKKILGRRDGWRRVWSKKWKDSWPTGAKTVFYMRNFGTRCFSSRDISSSSLSYLSDKVCHVLFYHDFTFFKQNYEIIKRSQNRVLHVKLWNMLLLSALERYLIVIFVITTLFLGLHFLFKKALNWIELDIKVAYWGKVKLVVVFTHNCFQAKCGFHQSCHCISIQQL